jgi:hypothetical protein
MTHIMQRGINGLKVNDELERKWKEAVWRNVKVLSQHFHGATKYNNENRQPV